MVMFPSLTFVTIHLCRRGCDSETEAVQDQVLFVLTLNSLSGLIGRTKTGVLGSGGALAIIMVAAWSSGLVIV